MATETLDALAQGRERLTWPSAFAALCALLLLAGCYEVGGEFLAPGEAQFVPGLAGTFTSDDGATTEVTLLPGNEYHYRRDYGDGDVSSGTFRAVRLFGDVYLLQLRDDDGGIYALFAEYTYDGSSATFWELDYVDGTVQPLAAAYGLTIDPDYPFLEGPIDKVRSFLFAHRSEHLARY
jgi:hypothetical protein